MYLFDCSIISDKFALEKHLLFIKDFDNTVIPALLPRISPNINPNAPIFKNPNPILEMFPKKDCDIVVLDIARYSFFLKDQYINNEYIPINDTPMGIKYQYWFKCSLPSNENISLLYSNNAKKIIEEYIINIPTHRKTILTAFSSLSAIGIANSYFKDEIIDKIAIIEEYVTNTPNSSGV